MSASERGQTALEFVVVLPALFVLILGILQAAQVMNAKQLVNAAAWHGARAAALDSRYGSWRGFELVPRLQLASVGARTGQRLSPAMEAFLRRVTNDYLRASQFMDREDLLRRLPYVLYGENVSISLSPGDPALVAPGDSISLEVQFRFPLELPVVDMLFDATDGHMDKKIDLKARVTTVKE